MLCYSVFAVILVACLFNSGDAAAPAFSSTNYAVCAEDAKAVGQTVATFAATDADNDAIVYTLAGTNKDDFGVSAANLNVAVVLDMATKPTYTLTVTATAGGETDTATYVIYVLSTCSGASALAASLTALLIGLVYILN